MMNIEGRDFERLDGKPSFWRSIVDGQSSFWRSINSQNIKKMYGKMTLGKWRRIVLFACVVALAIDPLFLLIPVIDSDDFCITYDKTLAIVVSFLRSVCDAFYVIHIYVHLRMEIKALRLSRQVSSIGQFRWKAVCLLFYLMVDIVSVFPFPQMVFLPLIQSDELADGLSEELSDKVSDDLVTRKILKWTILCQYLPRFGRTYPIFREVTKNTGNVAESKWIAATINLFLYMLCSYGFGAFWYVIAVEKQSKCWHDACKNGNGSGDIFGPDIDRYANGSVDYRNGTFTAGCKLDLLLCKYASEDNIVFLNNSCPLVNPTEIQKNSRDFNFGMFTDALKSGVLERRPRDFMKTFAYCFRWGLRNLSALGQNLETSSSGGENVFAIIITVSGLLLFAILIGNVQKYLQSSTTRVDAKEENKRDTEKWMSKRKLPKYLKKGIRNHREYKWRETRGMEEETLLQSLPKHLTKGIKRHLYRDLIQNLKLLQQFQHMDDRSLEDLCSRLKTAYYTANSYIVQEGEPVEDMLYILSGNLVTTTTGSANLGAGYLYGEELLDWAFDTQSSHYPISNRTVTAKTDVEGFILSADDLKFVATQCGLENC